MDVTQDVPVKIISNTHALTSHPKIKPPEVDAYNHIPTPLLLTASASVANIDVTQQETA